MWTCCLKDSCSTTSQGGYGKGLGPTCPADDSTFSSCNENHGPKPPKSFGREPELLLKAMSMSWSSWGRQRKKHHEKTTTWKNLEFHSLKLEVWHLSRMRPEANNTTKRWSSFFFTSINFQVWGLRVSLNIIQCHHLKKNTFPVNCAYLSFIATFYEQTPNRSLIFWTITALIWSKGVSKFP